MPLTVRNDYGTTFLPVDNSGSIGPGPTKGSITVAFYPRPNSKTVTALYNESPPCPFLKDEPLVWPESSAIWGGIGWFGPPFNTRVTITGGGFHPPSAAYPVPQPGNGQSNLHIWFVPRTERLAAQPCKP